MSLVDQILSDLQQLQNESKKNQPLKQLTQQAYEALRQLKGTQQTTSKDQFPTHLIMKVLSMASQTKYEAKQTAQPMLIISITQKLINMIKREEVLHLLHPLYLLRECPDDQVQLKLTQCTLQMVPQLIDWQNPEYYEKTLSVLYMLASSRNPIVQTTSISGAQQLIEGLFKQEPKMETKGAQNLFMDLIRGTQGHKVVWMQGTVSKTLSFDLILDIVKLNGLYYPKSDLLTKFINEFVSPTIYEEMALDDNDVKFNARRIRGAFRLMYYLKRDIPLVKHIASLFSRAPPNNYVRYWILEGIQELFSDQELLMILHQNPENQTQGVFSYLQHLFFLLKNAVEQQDTQQTKSNNYKTVKFMDSNALDFSETPVYSTFQFYKLLVDCVLALSEQLLQLAKLQDVHLGNKNFQFIKSSRGEDADQKIKDPRFIPNNNCKELFNIVEGIWGNMLKILKKIANSQIDERSIQNILNVTQIWINVTGSVGQLKVRDQFLRFLTSLCINENHNDPLSEKNLQSSKVLFNVAHCLGGIMDVNSWYLILSTIHVFDVQLAKTIQQTSQQTENNEILSWSQELQILQSVLDGLFTQSHLYDDQQLLQVLDALNQVTLGVIEQITTGPNSQSDSKALAFCLSKITQMASVNWHRVEVFWEFIAAHFSCVCKSRDSTVDVFTNLIEAGFNHFLRNPHQDHPQWDKEHWQSSLLYPLHEIVKFGARVQILQGLLRLLQNNGHEFSQGGFMSVVDILNLSCLDSRQDEQYIQVGFQLLQLIINQYLHALEPKTTLVLLPLIAEFRRRTSDSNISYTSINLIWQLADNLSKLQPHQATTQEIEDLWESVLYNLKDLCLDNSPDVRQSAFHIIIQITLINTSTFRIEFQVKLLRVCLLNIFDSLIGRVAQLQKQQSIFHIQTPKFLSELRSPRFTKFTEQDLNEQQPHELQWEETLKLIVTNLSKVIKKLQSIPNYEEHSQEIHNEVFVRLFLMLRFQSIELKHEIAKFIKECTQLIVEKLKDQQFDWSKEFLSSVNEFLFQKITDQKDVKVTKKNSQVLITKILPEFCDTFTLLMKAYYHGMKFEENFVQQMLETFQNIIEQPCKVGNLNVKLWFDDKFLHDFLVDFIPFSGQDLWRFLHFINQNLKKTPGQNVVTDGMLKKFIQVYTDIVCDPEYILNKVDTGDLANQHLALLNDFIQNVESLIEIRRDSKQLMLIKAYSNSQLPVWNQSTPLLQRVLSSYSNKVQSQAISKTILKPLLLNDTVSQEALKSCSDLEISWCQFCISSQPELVYDYWRQLQVSPYNDKILYETRKALISQFANEPNELLLQILRTVVEELIGAFNRDEQVHGSMPLPRWRVQELTYLLQELKKLEGKVLVKFIRSLTQLIATKEQEIKQPLQDLFLEVANVIEQQFN